MKTGGMIMLEGLLELHFYIENGEPMVFIKYFDDNRTEKTLRTKQKHIDSNLGKDVTELAKRIVSAYEKK